MIIREATLDDILDSVSIGKRFVEDSYYSNMTMNIEKMAEHAWRAIESEVWLYLVAIEDGKQIGFFTASLDTSMFSDSIIAIQDLMYIIPEKRKGMAAVRFLKEFEKWAVDSGADNLYFGITAQVDERFHKLAERLGFDYLGPQFGKKL
jgi:hypothetical protein